MSDFFLDKIAITNKILEIINPTYTDSDRQVALFRWWKNTRKNGGLALTSYGDNAFQSAQLEYHDSLLSSIITGDMILKMDRYLVCPYYIFYLNKKKFLRIYDSRVAVMIELYGNLENYIKSLSVKRAEI